MCRSRSRSFVAVAGRGVGLSASGQPVYPLGPGGSRWGDAVSQASQQISALLISAVVLFAGSNSAGAEASAVQRYYAGLRQRGLFDLAEGAALRQLASAVPAERRAVLAAELAITFAEHAKYLQGEEQADLWRRAEATLEDAVAVAQPPERWRLELVRGELELSRGETLRWLAELIPEQPAYWQRAEAALAAAAEQLAAVEASLTQAMRSAVIRQALPAGSAADLAEWRTQARLSLGIAEMERARLLPAEQRGPLLTAAAAHLSPVAGGPDRAAAAWRATVLLADVARLSGDFDLARRRLAALDLALLPEAAKDAVAAVSAALLVDENRPDKALELLLGYRRLRGQLSGELRLLQLQALLSAAAMMQQLDRVEEAAALYAQVETVVGWVETEQGGYWAYRARLRARSAEAAMRFGADVVAKMTVAQAKLAAGQTDAALAGYAEAIALAADRPEVAASLADTRARVLLQAGRFAEAEAAFHEVARDFSTTPSAAPAHLLSAVALGRLYEGSPGDASRTAYMARLEEHRQRYAGTATAAEATWRLGRFQENRRQYSLAIPLFRTLIQDNAKRAVARAALARCYDELLGFLAAERRAAATPAIAAVRDAQFVNWSTTAVAELTPLVASLPGRVEPLSAQEAELGLRAARILARVPASLASDAPSADRVIETLVRAAAVAHPADETAFWSSLRETLRPLQIASLAARGETQQAAALVGQMGEASPRDVLATLRGLSNLPPATSPEPLSKPRRADLIRQTASLLARQRAELSPSDVRELDEALAQADLLEGNATAAAIRFKQLLAQRPDDKLLLERAATALLGSAETATREQALDYLQRLENLERSGTAAWLAVRCQRIAALAATGDLPQARKLLGVTRILHPQLGDTASQRAFAELESTLDNRSTEAPSGERAQ